MTQTGTARGPLWGRTPASQQRRRDILLAGKKVFFQGGYQLASVDRIAEAAGTTKRTVYDHFGSKEALFTEVIAFAGGQFVGLLPSADDLPQAPAEGLRAFVARMRALVAAPDSLRFQRLIIAEAERHPAMGRALYDTAILGVERVLAAYLRVCVERGRLRDHDVEVSARLVLDVGLNGLRLRALMAAGEANDDPLAREALDRVIDQVIRDFAPAD
jgi:AcrR family transcriptional regulator